MPEAPETIVDRMRTIRRRAGSAVDRLGEVGAFGLVGSVLQNVAHGETGRKIQQIQQVYDTFGPDTTTNLLADRAVSSVIKRLPDKLRTPLARGARAVTAAQPVINTVMALARTLSKAAV